MSEIFLFRNESHSNILLHDVSTDGLAVQTNHHLIVHNKGVDDPRPGRTDRRVLADTTLVSAGAEVKYVFLSHQRSGHCVGYQ